MAAYQHLTNNLNAATLNIDGNEGNSVGLTTAGNSLGDAQTLGFHLAGVDIPHPTGHTVHKSGLTTKTGASLQLSNSSCKLEWVKRTAQEDTKTSSGTTQTVNKDVYVLAFTGCTAEGGGTEPSTPEGDCSNAVYKAANKSKCCPSASKTDTVCYKLDWVGIPYSSGGGDCEGAGCGSSVYCEGSCSLGESCHEIIAEPDAGVVNWGDYECDYVKNGW